MNRTVNTVCQEYNSVRGTTFELVYIPLSENYRLIYVSVGANYSYLRN